MLGAGGDGDQRLGGGLEKGGMDLLLVVVGDVTDLGRHCDDHMTVIHRQEFNLARRQTIRLWGIASYWRSGLDVALPFPWSDPLLKTTFRVAVLAMTSFRLLIVALLAERLLETKFDDTKTFSANPDAPV